MSYEAEKRAKTLCVGKGAQILYALRFDGAVFEYSGDDWYELNPIPGTARHREMQAREGLPMDDTEGES